jgi:CHASE2 domain-containing sensor protein
MKAGQYLKTRPASFWTRLVLIVTSGLVFGYLLEERPSTAELRFYSYRLLQKAIPTKKTRPKYTALIIIDDDEYWKNPELAHRVPINRKYLSQLVRALSNADPAVIGLDFDFSSPFPEAPDPDDPAYEQETRELTEALHFASGERPVILPASLGINAKGDYAAEPSVYDKFNPNNVLCFRQQSCTGYIALPFDPAVLPSDLHLANGDKLMPFSEALAEAYDDAFQPGGAYAEYMAPQAFQPVTMKASDVLRDAKQYKAKLHSKIAIIGGAWHTRAYGRGDLVDLHPTPLGLMSGVTIHANYVEAMLDSRTLLGLSTSLRLSLEWMLAFLLALGLNIPLLGRWGLGLLGLSFALLVVACIVFSVFGIFFEFVLPSLALLVHYVLEKVLHWRALALKAEESGMEV